VTEKDVTGREACQGAERSEARCGQCEEGVGVVYRAGCGREEDIA
jgi:hypothetical protein